MSYPSYSFGGYGGNYSPIPVNISRPVSTTAANSSSSAGFKGDVWEEFITGLQEKYPDLEGIDWESWEDWTDEEWQQLRESLSAMRSAETLAKFKADVIEKWDAYDLSDWEAFNSNWNAFIIDAQADENDDIELTWAGFIATYGCFGNSDPESGPDPDDIYCWKAYSAWTDNQWKNFRGLYNAYLDHEWKTFYETLQTKLEDYNTIDWESWRDWTDADWEKCLSKVSSSGGSLAASPGPVSSPCSILNGGYPGWGFPGVSSMGYAGLGASGIGYASWGGLRGGSGWGAPMGYGGWGAPAGGSYWGW